MSGASNLDWLYHLLGYTLAAAGLLLLLWALFWDRSRGRRRCPKCWYDMSGVPGLKCPECGRECKTARSLHRTRRRRLLAATGVVAVLVGSCLPLVTRFRREGWASVPTPLLIAALEATRWPRYSSAGDMAEEMMYRRGSLSPSTFDFVMRRMARHWAFNYRATWAAEVPIAVKPVNEFWYNDGGVNCVLQARLLNGAVGIGPWVCLYTDSGARYNSLDWGDGFCELGTLAEGTTSMTLELRVVYMDSSGSERLDDSQPSTWSGVLSWPIEVRARVDDVIKPVRSAAIDKELREGLVVRERGPFGLHRPGDRVNGFGFMLDRTARNMGVTPAMTVEFLRGTELIASTEIWDVNGELQDSGRNELSNELPFDDDRRAVQSLKLSDPGWSVRIRPSPGMALRDSASSKYWSGEIVIPANQIRVLPPGR